MKANADAPQAIFDNESRRNVPVCPHCGKTFTRITPRTPLINRSDGALFHVTLFAGPGPRPKPSGGFHNHQVVCYFAYAHDRFGPKNHTISVVITHAKEEPEEVHQQVEDAADNLPIWLDAATNQKRFTHLMAAN